MPLDVPPPAAQDEKVPLWLWVMLVLVCVAGVAFLSIFRSPSIAPVKEELTLEQEEAIFSNIRKENFKVPESESSGESLLLQGTENGYGTSGKIRMPKKQLRTSSRAKRTA